MFTLLNYLMKSPIQAALAYGTFRQAIDAAFITISLTEILDLATALSFVLSFIKLST